MEAGTYVRRSELTGMDATAFVMLAVLLALTYSQQNLGRKPNWSKSEGL